MRVKFYSLLLAAALLSTGGSVAQTSTGGARKAAPKRPAAQRQKPARGVQKAPKLDRRKQFALEVVNSAVAIPQSDQQDRLRILTSAAAIVLPLHPARARQLSREGLRIEQEMIQRGETPVASMLDSGGVDCKAVRSLVENVPVDRVDVAEQTLIAAISHCRNLAPSARRLVEAALEKRIAPARLTLALIEHAGPKAPWSQAQFDKLFGTLPDPAKSASEAPNYAAMYARMATEVDKEVARTSGLRFLTWLGKVEEGSQRNLAVNVATGAMRQALGEEAYNRALEGDVIARQVAQTSGQPGEVEHAPEESVSVLGAMSAAGADRTQDLEQLPASLRAREAAASGFATGTTTKDRKLAERYFDIAFRALDDVWDSRSERLDAPAVVQEVAEAAAHVDAVAALQRTQKLQDTTAQAIGMIAVARVVASESDQQAAQR